MLFPKGKAGPAKLNRHSEDYWSKKPAMACRLIPGFSFRLRKFPTFVFIPVYQWPICLFDQSSA